MDAERRIAAGWFVAVLVGAALAYGAHVHVPGDYKVDEPRYFATALTAFESGDWVVLRFFERPRLKKPPLQTWLVASSYQVFGVGLWQARLSSVLAGVGAVVLAAWLSSRLFGSRRAALYAACMLLGSPLFLRQAHWSLTDAGLTFWMLLSLCGFVVAFQGDRRGAWLAWPAMALALLQKGPVGVAIPLGVAFLWLLLERRRRDVSWRPIVDPWAIALFGLIVLPWPLLAMSRLGAEGFSGPVGRELGFHLGLDVGRSASHAVLYAWDLVRSLLPWTPLLLLYAGRQARDEPARLLWLWVGVIVGVFCLLVLKQRWRYLLPAMPVLAILCGRALDLLQQRRETGEPAGPALDVFHAFVSCWLSLRAVQGVALTFTAMRVIDTPRSILIGSAVTAGAALLALGLPWLRRRTAAHAWVVIAALGVAGIETLRHVSLPAGFVTSPAWQIARDEPGSLATLGLSTETRGWAWIGAGRSLPHHDVPENAEDWAPLARADRWLTDPDTARRVPRALGFREARVVEGFGRELTPVWRERDVASARESWRRETPALVLLERIDSDAP